MSERTGTLPRPARPDRAGRPLSTRVAIVAAYATAVVAILQALYPLVWMLFGSLKRPDELYSNVWGPPSDPQWSNYRDAWRTGSVGEHIVNSIHVTGLALLIILVVATPCAYAIAKTAFPGRRLLLGVCVAAVPFPPPVLGIPLFIVGRELNLVNSLNGLALVYAAGMLPMSIVILQAFFAGVPDEIGEAARVDGAGPVRALLQIMVPLVRPGLAFIMIVAFLDIWNELFLALIFLRSPDLQTIPLGLVSFFQQDNTLWTQYFAAQVMVVAPVIVAFVLVQRQFIAGLAAGSLKG